MFFAFPEDQLGRTCLVQHDIATADACLLSKGRIEQLQMLRKELNVSWRKYCTTYYYNNNIIIIIIIIIIITSDTGKSKL